VVIELVLKNRKKVADGDGSDGKSELHEKRAGKRPKTGRQVYGERTVTATFWYAARRAMRVGKRI